jgi:hypothetical protein
MFLLYMNLLDDFIKKNIENWMICQWVILDLPKIIISNDKIKATDEMVNKLLRIYHSKKLRNYDVDINLNLKIWLRLVIKYLIFNIRKQQFGTHYKKIAKIFKLEEHLKILYIKYIKLISKYRYINININTMSNQKINRIIEQSKETGVFPMLYYKNVSGKLRFWKIEVDSNDDGHGIITIRYGEVGTKNPRAKITIVKEGKNIGRSNETTPYEQALKTASERFIKKSNEAYLDIKDIPDPRKADVIRPMLVTKYTNTSRKRGKKIKMSFPCYIQKKRDGVRCLTTLRDNKIFLYSRHGKTYINCPHIVEELKLCYARVKNDTHLHLDGELYSHGMALQTLRGIAMRSVNLDTEENTRERLQIEFHIFDCLYTNYLKLNYKWRLGHITKFLKKGNKDTYKYLKLVDTDIVKSEDEMIMKTKEYVRNGYEGTILRDPNGVYELGSSTTGGRSYSVQKYKLENEERALILGIDESPNHGKYGYVFVCRTEKTYKTFRMTGIGTEEYKKEVLASKDQYRGCYIRYKYTNMTKQEIPSVPVPILGPDGKYIIEGKPLVTAFDEEIKKDIVELDLKQITELDDE